MSDCDLTEIEERLYSQIYHPVDSAESTNNYLTPASENNDPQPKKGMSNKRRYFNPMMNNLSVNVNVNYDNNTVPQQSSSHRYSRPNSPTMSSNSRNMNINADITLSEPFQRKPMGKPTGKPMGKPNPKFEMKLKNRQLKMKQNFEDIDLKQIKARVEKYPEYIKTLPPFIRKKLNKMNKRIRYIQKKKGDEQDKYRKFVTDFNRDYPQISTISKGKKQKGLPTDLVKLESSESKPKINFSDDTVICLSDSDSNTCVEIKSEVDIVILSSDDESMDVKNISLDSKVLVSGNENKDIFKRPNDDDVIFVEPKPTEVVIIDNSRHTNTLSDLESNSSISTKSSSEKLLKQIAIDKCKQIASERKELLSTPESSFSNDFLDASLNDQSQFKFNFSLHGNDFVPTKENTKVCVADLSESESSCSTTDITFITSSKSALFNEVDFDSPSKNIFDGANMENFSTFITPKRSNITPIISCSSPITTSNQNVENISEDSPSGIVRKKETLPNLSTIESLTDSMLEPDEGIVESAKNKKIKKPKKALFVTEEVNTETSEKLKKKKKNTESQSSIVEDKEEESEIVINKKKKKKKKTSETSILEATTENEDNDSQEESCVSDSNNGGKKKKIHKNIESDVDIQEESGTDLNTTKKSKKKRDKNKNLEIEDVVECKEIDSQVESNITVKKSKKKVKNVDNQSIVENIDKSDVENDSQEESESNNTGKKSKKKCEKSKNLEIATVKKPKKKRTRSNASEENDNQVMPEDNEEVDKQQMEIDNQEDTIIEKGSNINKSSKRRLERIPSIETEDTNNVDKDREDQVELPKKSKKKRIKLAEEKIVSQEGETKVDELPICTTNKDGEVNMNKIETTIAIDINTSTTLIAPVLKNDDKSNTAIDGDSTKLKEEYCEKKIVEECQTNIVIDDSDSDYNIEIIEKDPEIVDIDDSDIEVISSVNSANDVTIEEEEEDEDGDEDEELSEQDSSEFDPDFDDQYVDDDSDDMSSVHEEVDVQLANISGNSSNDIPVDDDDEEYDDRAVVKSIQSNMSNNPNNWRILQIDRMPPTRRRAKVKCRRCREDGHYAGDCPNKRTVSCSLCGLKGHSEPRCPNKLCTQCGRYSKYFTTFCSSCANSKHTICKLCRMNGHNNENCPDLWRRYHLTTTQSFIVRPKQQTTLNKTGWCSGCGNSGHFEHQCKYFAREHPPANPDVIEYVDILGKPTQIVDIIKNTLNQTRSGVTKTQANPESSNKNSKANESLKRKSQSPQPSTSAKRRNIQTEENSDQLLQTRNLSPIASCSKEPLPLDLDNRTSAQPEVELVVDKAKKTNLLNILKENLKTFIIKDDNMPSQMATANSNKDVTISSDQEMKEEKVALSQREAVFLKKDNEAIKFLKVVSLNVKATIKVDFNKITNVSVVIIQGTEKSCGLVKSKLDSFLHSELTCKMPDKLHAVVDMVGGYMESLKEPRLPIEELKEILNFIKNNTNTAALSKQYEILNRNLFGLYKINAGVKNVRELTIAFHDLKAGDKDYTVLLATLKRCLHYLFWHKRLIHIYENYLEKLKVNDNTLKNTCAYKMIIDVNKMHYVNNSKVGKCLLSRWRMKASVTFEQTAKNCYLVLDGTVKSVHSVQAQFILMIGKTIKLPHRKKFIIGFITDLTEKIKSIEQDKEFNVNALVEQIKTLQNTAKSFEEHQLLYTLYESLHIYVFAIRNRDDGPKQVAIIKKYEELFNNPRDYQLAQDQWKEIQDAYNFLQYSNNGNIQYYEKFLEGEEYSFKALITITESEHKLLTETEKGNQCLVNLKKLATVTFSRNARNDFDMVIAGAEASVLSCERKLAVYIERASINELDREQLKVLLQSINKDIWINSCSKAAALDVYNEIKQAELNRSTSTDLLCTRSKYKQLHVFLFGCCALSQCSDENDILNLCGMYLDNAEEELEPFMSRVICKAYNLKFSSFRNSRINYEKLLQFSNDRRAAKMFLEFNRNTYYINSSFIKQYFTNDEQGKQLVKHCLQKNMFSIKSPNLNRFANDNILKISFSNYANSIVMQQRKSIVNRVVSLHTFYQTPKKVQEKLTSDLDKIYTMEGGKVDPYSLMQDIALIKNNTDNIALVDEMYMRFNMYLFGYCKLKDGDKHLNNLKTYLNTISVSDSSALPDINFSSIESYEYLFYKGEKCHEDYDILVYSLISQRLNVEVPHQKIPIKSQEIYEYFTCVKEGRQFIESHSLSNTKIEIVTETDGKYFVLWGNLQLTDPLMELLVKEISTIKHLSLPFSKHNLLTYLKEKMISLQSLDCDSIDQNTINELNINEKKNAFAKSFLVCASRITSLKQSYAMLHMLFFGIYHLKDGKLHLDLISKYIEELEYYEDEYVIDLTFIKAVYSSVCYIFSEYRNSLWNYDSLYRESHIDIPIGENIQEFLSKSTEGILNSSPNVSARLCGNVIRLAGNNSNMEKFRKQLETGYLVPLKNLPVTQEKMKNYLNELILRIENLNADPRVIYNNIITIDSSDNESKPNVLKKRILYSELHMSLFGVHGLKDGVEHLNLLKMHTEILRNEPTILSFSTFKVISTSVNYLTSGEKLNEDYNKLLGAIVFDKSKQIPSSKDIIIRKYPINEMIIEYFTLIDAGKLCLEDLKTRIDVTLVGRVFIFKGTLTEVKATKSALNHFLSSIRFLPVNEDMLCAALRRSIESITKNSRLNPVKLWQRIVRAEGRDVKFGKDVRRDQMLYKCYEMLHVHLFGVMLKDRGQEFLEFLQNYVEETEGNLKSRGAKIVNLELKNRIYIAYEYIFGKKRRNIDYLKIIGKFRPDEILESLYRKRGQIKKQANSEEKKTDLLTVNQYIATLQRENLNNNQIKLITDFIRSKVVT